MGASSHEVWQDLSSLAESYAELGRALLHAARQLHAPGVLPSRSVVEEVDQLGRAFAGVRERTCQLAAGLGLDVPVFPPLESLRSVASLLERVVEAEERLDERRARAASALTVLDHVSRLRHTHLDAFPPLADCQEKARALRLEITEAEGGSRDEVISRLAAGDHPFADLLAMLEGNEATSDDRWQALFDSVCGAFGRALAAAVARSRVVDPEAVAGAPEPEPETVSPPATAGQMSEPSGPIPEGMSPESPGEEVGPAPPQWEPLVRLDHGAAWSGTAFGTGEVAGPLLVSTDEALNSVVAEAIHLLPKGLTTFRSVRRVGRPALKKSAPGVETLETVRLLSTLGG
jgi:hypothetical protein